jgi:hypothetical protein
MRMSYQFVFKLYLKFPLLYVTISISSLITTERIVPHLHPIVTLAHSADIVLRA